MVRKNLKKGFSLVELLVVITIIAILSVTAYIAVGGQTVKAKNSRRMNDLTSIQTALELYAVANDTNYPGATSALSPTYISKVPVDPLKSRTQNYPYAVASGNKTYQLAATLEDENGGLAHKAYVIGNGSNLITNGCTYSPTTGDCDAGTPCTVADGGTTCLPYKP